MKASLHRSLTFWFGVLVMAFICWAWWDSTRAWSKGNLWKWSAGNTSSGVTLGWRPVPISSGVLRYAHIAELREAGLQFTRPRFFRKAVGETTHEARLRYDRDFPSHPDDRYSAIAWAFHDVEMGAPGAWLLYVPHWCLLAAAMPLWLGLFIWRVHRRKHSVSP